MRSLWSNSRACGLFAHCVLTAAAALGACTASAQRCADAHYRWNAKTITSLDSGLARPTTIEELLTRWPVPPIGPGPAYWCTERIARERGLIRVEGWLRFADTTKDDGDWHLELTAGRDDPAGRCIVAEIPDPRWGKAFAGPRATLDSLLPSARWKKHGRLDAPVRVRVTGLPFFDGEHIHGRKLPRAQGHGSCNSSLRSLWEIHPVYRIEPVIL